MQSTLNKHIQRNILLFALFCTAFSALVYELVWCRELSYIFGATALAASSVLAVFMAGLALGSLYAGKILESRWGSLATIGFPLSESLEFNAQLLLPSLRVPVPR